MQRWGKSTKHFYRFPTNTEVNIKWKKICGIKLTENCRNKYVCEDHFQKDFVNFTKHALNPFVVPSQLSFENNSETVNNNEQLNLVNSFIAASDLNSTSIISQATAEVSDKIDSDTVSKDALDNLNVEENVGTPHFESINDNSTNNILYIRKLNNFHEQDCICEDTNCQLDDNDNIIVMDNLAERNEITSVQTKQRKTSFLTEAGVSLKAMTPTKRTMYKIHRRIVNKLSKVKKSLHNEKDTLKKFKKLYKDNVLQCIDNQLNTVTKTL